MTNIYNLTDRMKSAGKTTFTAKELSSIISIYSDNVSKGIWRDYALDCTSDMAVFSIFRNSQDNPLYSITKQSIKNKPLSFNLHKSGKNIKKGNSLEDILDFLKGQI